MKRLPHFGLLLLLFASSCARQSSPMGGPRDEDPPQLVSSDPGQGTTNIKPSEITLLFSEYIKVENPTKQIIITPRINPEEIVFTPQRNRLNIQIDQDLEDSTTYVFNFQKSVQDITEGNPAQNLRLVFSTGPIIDSLKFSGSTSYVFPTKNNEIVDVLVGLYPVADTTDIFSAPPYYIAQADSLGNFEITNIKAGEYRAYAWHDDNNSLKAEFRSEAYGFLDEPVIIDKDIEGVHFNLFRGDLTPIKINRSAASGSNFDVILNKSPVEVHITHPDKNHELFYRLKERTIRFYHTDLVDDSTSVNLSIKDSVGFSIDTTLYAKFESSDRNQEKLDLSANSGAKFLDTIRSVITFNKPVNFISYDSLFVRYDSASILPIDQTNVRLQDSTDYTRYVIDVAVPDTLNQTRFSLFAADSTFRDVEGQWNTAELMATYNQLDPETLSEALSGTIETDELPLIVQLLDTSDKLVQEVYLTESPDYVFNNIEPGNYKLRAIVDRNQNKRWDPGNFYKNTQPEPVYYFYDEEKNTDQFLLRGSWTLTDINVKKGRASGIYAEEMPVNE